MLYQKTCNTFLMKLPKWIQEFLFSSNILVQDYNFKMLKNRFAYPNISNMQGKRGKVGKYIFWGGCFENSKYDGKYFYVAFQALNKCLFFCFFLRSQGWIFVKLSMKLMKFFGKKSFLFHQKKGENLLFVALFCFFFVFYVAGFLSLRTKSQLDFYSF